MHKTADGTTTEKQVSSGKQRKQPSATVVMLTAVQYRETQSVNLWITVESDYVAAGIRGGNKEGTGERERDKEREFPQY